MGWGRRGARFYCEVASSRKNNEVILGDRDSGIHITVAGEFGSLTIDVYACGPNKGEHDRFKIEFHPWRSCEKPKAEGIPLLTGVLNFDTHTDGNVTLRLNHELLELLSLMRAKEIMVKGTAAEGL